MKASTLLHQLLRHIAIYHFLLCFFVCFVVEVKEVRGRTDLKTKLLIQNIRTHMAQKIDEIVKKKECEEGLTLCKSLKSKSEEADEEKSEEIPPPPKILRGQHKPTIKVSRKDVIQTLLPKVRKNLHRKPVVPEESEKFQKKFSPLDMSQLSQTTSEEEKIGKTSEGEKEKFIFYAPSKFPVEEKQPRKQDTKFIKPSIVSSKTEIKETTKAKILKGEGDKRKENKELLGKKKEGSEKEKIKKDSKEGKVDKKLREEILIFLSSSFIFGLDTHTAENNLCLKQSQVYVKNLKKLKTWALMMYDASAKLPSGILQGNINQYGDFDECLSINAVFKRQKNKTREFSAIQGKYCLASADLESKVENESFRKALERVKSFEFVKSTVDDPSHFIPRFSTVNWGICIPSSCLAVDVENFLKSHLQNFNDSLGLLFKVRVEEENCVVKNDLKFHLETGTVITLTFYLAVLLTSLYATYIDIASKKREKEMESARADKENVTQKGSGENAREYAKNIIMAFSIRKNLRKLFQSKSSTNCIESINGMKSIFTLVLYFAHKTIPLGMTPFCNRIFLTKVSNEPITVFMRASMIYTDSFLLISGVLTSYNLAREISEKRKISWAKKSIDRFIRLTPASVAVILFYAYLWDHLGSGPAWNSIVKKNSELCRKYLWRNLLFVQNFFAFEDMCAPQTHQLALDLQLSLLAPLFVHLLHNYYKVGMGILQALFLLSSIMRYITTANNELSVIVYHGMHVSQLYKTANLLYSQSLHRASPYILGTIVGYYLKQYEKRLDVPKVVTVLGWISALGLAYYSAISPYNLASGNYRYNVQEAAQYAALSPMAWSLALSWVITACHLGCGGKLNQFLCQKAFLIFSRISYSIYLTQFLVFFYNVSVKKIPDVFTVTGSLNITEFLAVILFSTVVALFFDIPIGEIKSIILNNNNSKGLKTFEGDNENIKKMTDSEQNFEISEENISQDSEEITEELVEEEGDEINEDDKIEEFEDENLEQNSLVQEIIEENDLEEENVEEDMEEDDDDEENTTTFQLRLPKFSTRPEDDLEDKDDWLIVETEKDLNK